MRNKSVKSTSSLGVNHGGTRARWKPASELHADTIKKILAKRNIPVESSCRRAVLVQLYEKHVHRTNVNSQPLTQDSSTIEPSLLSRERLKQLLNNAGIEFRPKARQATLVKLYRIHVAKENVQDSISLTADNPSSSKVASHCDISPPMPQDPRGSSSHQTSLQTSTSNAPLPPSTQSSDSKKVLPPAFQFQPPPPAPPKRSLEALYQIDSPEKLHRDRLKHLLKAARVQHRPNARQSTLIRLYRDHLANSKKSAVIPNTSKRPRVGSSTTSDLPTPLRASPKSIPPSAPAKEVANSNLELRSPECLPTSNAPWVPPPVPKVTKSLNTSESFPLDNLPPLFQTQVTSPAIKATKKRPLEALDEEDPGTLSRDHLKHLLKAARIQHRPNAHHPTLIRLYRDHLEKTKKLAYAGKRPRGEPSTILDVSTQSTSETVPPSSIPPARSPSPQRLDNPSTAPRRASETVPPSLIPPVCSPSLQESPTASRSTSEAPDSIPPALSPSPPSPQDSPTTSRQTSEAIPPSSIPPAHSPSPQDSPTPSRHASETVLPRSIPPAPQDPPTPNGMNPTQSCSPILPVLEQPFSEPPSATGIDGGKANVRRSILKSHSVRPTVTKQFRWASPLDDRNAGSKSNVSTLAPQQRKGSQRLIQTTLTNVDRSRAFLLQPNTAEEIPQDKSGRHPTSPLPALCSDTFTPCTGPSPPRAEQSSSTLCPENEMTTKDTAESLHSRTNVKSLRKQTGAVEPKRSQTTSGLRSTKSIKISAVQLREILIEHHVDFNHNDDFSTLAHHYYALVKAQRLGSKRFHPYIKKRCDPACNYTNLRLNQERETSKTVTKDKKASTPPPTPSPAPESSNKSVAQENNDSNRSLALSPTSGISGQHEDIVDSNILLPLPSSSCPPAASTTKSANPEPSDTPRASSSKTMPALDGTSPANYPCHENVRNDPLSNSLNLESSTVESPISTVTNPSDLTRDSCLLFNPQEIKKRKHMQLPESPNQPFCSEPLSKKGTFNPSTPARSCQRCLSSQRTTHSQKHQQYQHSTPININRCRHRHQRDRTSRSSAQTDYNFCAKVAGIPTSTSDRQNLLSSHIVQNYQASDLLSQGNQVNSGTNTEKQLIHPSLSGSRESGHHPPAVADNQSRHEDNQSRNMDNQSLNEDNQTCGEDNESNNKDNPGPDEDNEIHDEDNQSGDGNNEDLNENEDEYHPSPEDLDENDDEYNPSPHSSSSSADTPNGPESPPSICDQPSSPVTPEEMQSLLYHNSNSISDRCKDPQSVLITQVSQQVPRSKCSIYTHEKRSTKDIPDLPPSSRLTVAQMKQWLDKYHIQYKSRDRKPRIVELYDGMRTRQALNARNEPPVNQPSDLNNNNDDEPPLSRYQRKDRRGRIRLPSSSSIDDQNDDPILASPPLLFSESMERPDCQPFNHQSPEERPSDNMSIDSQPPNTINSPDKLNDEEPEVADDHLDDHMSIDKDPSDVFRWRNSVPPSCDDCRCKSQSSPKRHPTNFEIQILNKMDTLIETVGDLTVIHATSHSSSQSRTAHREKGKSKARNTATKTSQGGEFHALIRTHIATLLGSKGPTLPHHNPALERCMDVDNDEEDPNYPYPGGPGHPSATRQTLDIMFRMMKEAGIQSFRPNFTKPFDSPDNEHLLDLAVNSFLELVECQEYTGIDMDTISKEDIRNAIFLHVTQRLRRRYREENKWDDDARSSHEKKLRRNARLNNLRHSRLESLEPYEDLLELVPIVKVCCSDDDTDDEESQPIQVSYSKSQPKKCVVRFIPWRHTLVERIMDKIDQLKAVALAQTPKGNAGAPSRIRRRITRAEAVSSDVKPPSKVPQACYMNSWLESHQHCVDALKLRSKPHLEKLLERLNTILS